MRRLTYLNVVLTVIAVLLSAMLWTMWTTSPIALSAPAHAQGISNPAADRLEQVAQLKTIAQKVEELTSLFRSGQAKVRIENPDAADKKDAPRR